MNKSFLVVLATATLAAAGGFFAAMMMESSDPGVTKAAASRAEELVGKHRPDFQHSDTTGRIVSSGDFEGDILLVNFWATWCQPCVEEMPMLEDLQKDRAGDGLQVVGIALDDPERAAGFASGLGISYPILVGQADVVVTGRRYGNSSGMLPFSVLIDRRGLVRWTHLGVLDRPELERQISLIE